MERRVVFKNQERWMVECKSDEPNFNTFTFVVATQVGTLLHVIVVMHDIKHQRSDHGDLIGNIYDLQCDAFLLCLSTSLDCPRCHSCLPNGPL